MSKGRQYYAPFSRGNCGPTSKVRWQMKDMDVDKDIDILKVCVGQVLVFITSLQI